MLLAAGGALVDQPRLVRPGPIMAAAGAAKSVRPARPKQVVPALLVGPEPLEKARQIARQILRQHRALQPVRQHRHTTSTASPRKPNLIVMDS
jgi:hypothetical protein